MSLIDNEKRKLLYISCEYVNDINHIDYLKRELEGDSYWISRDVVEKAYLYEYDFENPNELKELIKNRLPETEEKLATVAAVATFKMQNSLNNQNDLPDTIYNF